MNDYSNIVAVDTISDVKFSRTRLYVVQHSLPLFTPGGSKQQ